MHGYTANAPGRTYRLFEYGITLQPHTSTVLPFTISTPLIDTQNAIPLPPGRTTRHPPPGRPHAQDPGPRGGRATGGGAPHPGRRATGGALPPPVLLGRTPFPLPEG